MRTLRAKGFDNFLTRTHAELDLTDQAAVEAFFAAEQPDYVFLAAARSGRAS
jgi:GDP-L-fucose synthase